MQIIWFIHVSLEQLLETYGIMLIFKNFLSGIFAINSKSWLYQLLECTCSVVEAVTF